MWIIVLLFRKTLSKDLPNTRFLREGCSYHEIAKRVEIGRNTIEKYRKGDPKELSMYGIHQSKLDSFHDFIINCLKSGWSKSNI